MQIQINDREGANVCVKIVGVIAAVMHDTGAIMCCMSCMLYNIERSSTLIKYAYNIGAFSYWSWLMTHKIYVLWIHDRKSPA